MRTLSVIVLCFLLVAALAPLAAAATIHGTIYDQQLRVAQDVLVSIDTQPIQRILSTDGTYAFNMPPGNYTISLFSARSNISASERVTVAQDGNFSFDLFLLPGLEENEQLYSDISADFTQTPTDPEELPASRPGPWPIVIFLAALAAITGFLYWLWHHLKRARPGEEVITTTDEVRVGTTRPEDILAILKETGGRMTQKELRKRLPYGEAKVSLLVAELEAKGLIKKLKRGRENIIVLT